MTEIDSDDPARRRGTLCGEKQAGGKGNIVGAKRFGERHLYAAFAS
jgi:hypothetical protein